MLTLKPKNYILSTQQTEEYECSICNELAETPYRCQGPCRKIFCRSCISYIKNTKNQCPYKCSSPFQLTQQKEVNFEYRCPFDPEHCNQAIKSLSDFFSHVWKCQYVPTGWKQKEENYNRYRCEKGHDLYYFDLFDLMSIYGQGYFKKMCESICCLCQKSTLSKTICPQCSAQDKLHIYCTGCKRTPCTKYSCPVGHQMKKFTTNVPSRFVCDFCGGQANLPGPNVYYDQSCDFGVCQPCFMKLPETHELVPFKTPKNVIEHLYSYEVLSTSPF